MRHEILHQPVYALLKIQLEAGEGVRAEAGAMVTMSDGVQIETKAQGGVLKALKRSVLGGESFFVNNFRTDTGGEVSFAPSLPGDITGIGLQGRTIFAQSGAYLASTMDIEVDSKWGGAKTFFSGEGLFMLRLTGEGSVWVSSYGAIVPYDLKAGERMIVDTGHIVAFSEGMGYQVRRVGGMKSTLFSGEGLVCEMTGPGRLWIQTRSEDAFLSWLIPRMPASREHERGGLGSLLGQ